MKDVRCALVASYFGPYYGNFIASIIAFKREMIKRRYYVIFIFPKETKDFSWASMLEAENVKIYYLDYSPYSVKNVVEMRKILKIEGINLIYSRMCGWDFTARFAAPNLPLIWHMEMRVDLTNRIRYIKNWIKFKILGAWRTYHIAVSQVATNSINSLNPKHRCIYIPNALNTERLTNEYPIVNKKRVHNVLIFGWAPVVKGLDTAIEACQKLNQNEISFRLLISAQEKTFAYMNENFPNIPDWIELLPPTNDIKGLYEKADIMLSASRTEGFSYCVAEAIYSGIPVVISDIPGTVWAKNFNSVHVFETANSDDLARVLTETASTGISFDEQVENRCMMLERYSMDSWVNQIMDVIEGI